MGSCQHGVRIADTCQQCAAVPRCEHGVALTTRCPACVLRAQLKANMGR